jgi:hypothetical protein
LKFIEEMGMQEKEKKLGRKRDKERKGRKG